MLNKLPVAHRHSVSDLLKAPSEEGEVVYSTSEAALAEFSAAIRDTEPELAAYLQQLGERLRILSRLTERLLTKLSHREEAITVYLEPEWAKDARRYAEELDYLAGIGRPET